MSLYTDLKEKSSITYRASEDKMLGFAELGDSFGGPRAPSKKHDTFPDASLRFGQTGA